MLKLRLLHPGILAALARAGHGSRVLIADGNYSVATGSPPGAEKVFLNLTPGVVSVIDVLKVLRETIPIEAAMVMLPHDGSPQAVHEEFRELLPEGMELRREPRAEFIEAARSPHTALAIATGEPRRFANLLLTIGVVTQKDA